MTATAYPTKRGAVDAVGPDKRQRAASDTSESLGVVGVPDEAPACGSEADSDRSTVAAADLRTDGLAEAALISPKENSLQEEAKPDEGNGDQALHPGVTAAGEEKKHEGNLPSDAGEGAALGLEAAASGVVVSGILDESPIMDLLPGAAAAATVSSAADVEDFDLLDLPSDCDSQVGAGEGAEEAEEELGSDDDIVATPPQAEWPSVPSTPSNIENPAFQEIAPPLPHPPAPERSHLRRRDPERVVAKENAGRATEAVGSDALPEKSKAERVQRISFSGPLEDSDADLVANVIKIVNHRGHDLWYTNPGQQVECSWCDSMYPQVFGRLSGAEGRSQMSQPDFICINCIAAENGNAVEGWQEILMNGDDSNEEDLSQDLDGLEEYDDEMVDEGDLDAIAREGSVDDDGAMADETEIATESLQDCADENDTATGSTHDSAA